jgi:hypothetical protein
MIGTEQLGIQPMPENSSLRVCESNFYRSIRAA